MTDLDPQPRIPAAHPDDATLDTLARECDALFERMQRPDVEAGTERGFNAPPEEMGPAALAAARRLRET